MVARLFDTYVAALVCTRCGARYGPRHVSHTCPACPDGAGLLDTEYDLDRVNHDFAWSDLVNAPPVMWRYGPLLPVAAAHLGAEWPIGWTPLYASTSLAALVGVERLLIKDEGRNPHGSVADRSAAIGAIRAADAGARRLAGAGDTRGLVSLAAWAAAAAIPAVLFATEEAPGELEVRAQAFGATVLRVRGGPAAARAVGIEACGALGWYCAVDGYNPYLLDGRQTLGLEIAEACMATPPDWLAVGSGQAETIAAIHKALRQMNALELIDWMPRLVTPSMESSDLFAERARRAIEETGGAEIVVEDEAAAAMQRQVAGRVGLATSVESAAALCAVQAAVHQGVIGRRESVVVCLTGGWSPLGMPKVEPAPVIEPTVEAVRQALAAIGEAA